MLGLADVERRFAESPGVSPKPLAKKLFIKTYGCQMNVYDSARMAELLAPLGYAPTEDAGGGRHGHPQHMSYS